MELGEEKEITDRKELISLNINPDNFDLLMSIYKMALDKVYDKLTKVQETINYIYGYNAINNITKRIKTPDSIVKKLNKKKYAINMKNIIDNIFDIAGIRIACPIKSDINTIVDIIRNLPDIKIIETKDYISKPKRSGYSAYHIIIETPIQIDDQNVPVKVEVQIRTMAMDFWATNEHRVRYKSNKKLSKLDSRKLTVYAKILNLIDDKIMEIYNKQELV